MEKKDHNPKDKKSPIGLMEYIRSQQETTESVDMREELLKPYRPPKINTITCGTELAEQLQALLNL